MSYFEINVPTRPITTQIVLQAPRRHGAGPSVVAELNAD